MKNLLLGIICLSFCGTVALAAGKSVPNERILLEDSKVMNAEINNKTLRCSMLGYGFTELKINLKGLDGWTILDHSNARFGEFLGQPCMTAGACKLPWDEDNTGFDLEEILRTKSGEETIRVHRQISEVKTLRLNAQNKNVCIRTITEKLNTTVAGIKFHHARAFDETFAAEVCAK